VDFKVHSSGFKGTPQEKIDAFAQLSREQDLNYTWDSSKGREIHIRVLLAKGFPLEGPESANKQADIDFNDYIRELDKSELTPNGKVRAFAEYRYPYKTKRRTSESPLVVSLDASDEVGLASHDRKSTTVPSTTPTIIHPPPPPPPRRQATFTERTLDPPQTSTEIPLIDFD